MLAGMSRSGRQRETSTRPGSTRSRPLNIRAMSSLPRGTPVAPAGRPRPRPRVFAPARTRRWSARARGSCRARARPGTARRWRPRRRSPRRSATRPRTAAPPAGRGRASPGARQHRVHIAQVGPDHRHRLVVGQQRLGPHEHHRVVVDVDDAGIGVAVLGDLVRVRADRQPGADSRNWRIPASLAKATARIRKSRLPREGIPHLRHELQPAFGHLPVGGEVVPAAEHVVVHPGGVRDIRAEAERLPALLVILGL